MRKKQDPFASIRPYTTEEIPYAINRMLMSPQFVTSLTNFIETANTATLVRRMRKLKTTDDLQREIFFPMLHTFIHRSCEELTFGGFDRIDMHKPHVFIANHRDIIMDSAILQYYLISKNLPGTRSGIGDNLLMSPLFTDIAKTNNMFTVFRSHDTRTMLASSKLLSEYIRQSITKDKISVWISQRNGRTKDGLDKTQQGVLKMLYSSSRTEVMSSLKELNIVPLSISYEYEPCDQMKARELLKTKQNKSYVKDPQEDYNSITKGIFSYKGRVHMEVGEPINPQLDENLKFPSANDALIYVCECIDKEIHRHYRLWENNYIAYDVLHNSSRFAEEYMESEKNEFIKYIRRQANIADANYTRMKQQLLAIYANPVEAFLQMGGRPEGEEA
ncbi:MAG: acyltransferase [Bacteroidales bacterium]|nr:acyltransferase [Bacteroidales bacterium]